MNPAISSPISYTHSGFLSGFCETSIENPASRINGDCIVHFGGKHSECKMFVKLVNGVRDGAAIIMTKEYEFIKLTYRNGEMTGEVEKMDRYLNVLLKGFLVNGEEKGVFVEYNHGTPVWRGYYRHGKRFSEVVKSDIIRHFYEERSVKNQFLLSIAQYDDSLRDKNGQCFEYEDGVVKRKCQYENGERKQIIREYDVNAFENKEKKPLKSSFLNSLFDNPSDDSMILYDLSKKSGYGVLRSIEKCYEIQWIPNDSRVIEVDLISHVVRGYQNNKLIDVHCDQEVMDLDVNGRRWEGSVRDGKPFGYGVLFNEEGQKTYEGFMIDQTRICFGREYYNDIEKVSYVGCYFDGKHFGYGVLYDRNGVVDYEGIWKYDKPYQSETDDHLLDNHVDSIEIGNNMYDDLTEFIHPYSFDSCKRIVIGDYSLRNIRLFAVVGLSELESVSIGHNSLRLSSTPFSLYECRNNGGICRIENCPKLMSIRVKEYSFTNHGSFELTNLPSLESIEIGDYCFSHASELSLSCSCE